ncbi:MAG: YfhO family protein [Vicinamibacterales bacterium]
MIAGVALLASLAMLAFMGRSIVTGDIPFTGDLLHFHYPLRRFYADALASGDSVAWMPALYNGFYVAGEGQLGPFHPLHWLLYRLLPLDTAFAIEIVLAYPLAFGGMWLFLRRWCDRGPAALGAMAFTFSGFMLQHGVHPNLVLVVAHLPWLLWAADRAFDADDRGTRAAAAGVAGLLVGSQLLFGHPQALWLSLLALAAYVVFLMVRGTGQAPLRAGIAVAGGVLLGAAVGALQVLATLSATAASTRAADTDFAATFALEPRLLLQLVEPYLFWGRVTRWTEVAPAGDELGAYGGAVTLVLTAWWVGTQWATDRLRSASGRLGVATLAFGAIGLWLATGSYGKLYLLQTGLPLVGGFRVPARFILFADLALAITAAFALQEFLRQTRHPRAGLAGAWGAAAASGIVAVLLITRESGSPTWPVMLGPILFATAAALVTLARHARIAMTMLVLLAGADEAVYGLAGVAAWQDFVTRDDVSGFVETPAGMRPSGGRMAHGGFPNLYTLAGYRVLDGYTALPPTRLLDYGTPNALRVAEVAYVNSRFREATRVPADTQLGGSWFAAAATPLPRARLVARVQASANPAADLATIDVATTALTTRALNVADEPPGHARVIDDRPGRIRVQVDAPAAQLLVLSESFHDGWRVTVDGRDAPVERVNGDFIGCVVRDGDREVTFQFRPTHLIVGGWISAAAALAAGCLVLWPVVGRQRR